MNARTSQHGFRQRIAQIFRWLLGGAQTRDQDAQRASEQRVAQVFHWLRAGAQTRAQYRHSNLHQADGVVRSADDPDAFQQQGQQYQQFIQQQQERMRRHGRHIAHRTRALSRPSAIKDLMPGSARLPRGSRSSWRSSRHASTRSSTPSQEHQQDQGMEYLSMATPTHARSLWRTDRDALILEKLAGMEEAVASLVPLLEKIITQLETQAPPTTVPMATYADLYDEPDAGPPEGELVAAPPAAARSAAALVGAAHAGRAMNVVDLILELGRWGQTHRTEMLTGLLGLPVALGVTSLVLRGRRAATTTHGSARWATPREVRQAGLYGRQGVVLGRLGGRLLGDASETHVLLVAPTRSGKGVGVIIPTLCPGRRVRSFWTPRTARTTT